MLTREEILAASNLKRETVEVPELGGSVLVQELDGEGRDAYEASLWKDGELDMSNRRAKLVALGCVTKAGAKLFTLDDVPALGNLSGAALERVASMVRRLSGLNEESKEEAEGN